MLRSLPSGREWADFDAKNDLPQWPNDAERITAVLSAGAPLVPPFIQTHHMSFPASSPRASFSDNRGQSSDFDIFDI